MNGSDLYWRPVSHVLEGTAELLRHELCELTRASMQLIPHRTRVMPHCGHQKAVAVVAHAIPVTVYHLLVRGTTYQEPGTAYDDRRHAERVRRRAIQTVERQGYRVMLEPTA